MLGDDTGEINEIVTRKCNIRTRFVAEALPLDPNSHLTPSGGLGRYTLSEMPTLRPRELIPNAILASGMGFTQFPNSSSADDSSARRTSGDGCGAVPARRVRVFPCVPNGFLG